VSIIGLEGYLTCDGAMYVQHSLQIGTPNFMSTEYHVSDRFTTEW